MRSARGVPLSGAVVFLEGVGQEVATGPQGRFQVTARLDGEYAVSFRHARLDSLGFTPEAVPVRLARGQRATVTLALPSEPAVAARLCSQGLDSDERVIVGRVQGRGDDAGQQLLREAKMLEQAGAGMIVLEAIPAALAGTVTEALAVPTIGIGAGADCSGQVLVLHDMLDVYPGKKAKFVKNYMRPGGSIQGFFGNAFFGRIVHEIPAPGTWDFSTFNFDSDMDKVAQIEGGNINAMDPNLKAFYSRGGKLIQYHGWADPQIPAGSSVEYYKTVLEANGGINRVKENHRLFMVPGMAHCGGGDGPSSFNSEATAAGWNVVSIDPIYELPAHSIQSRCETTMDRMIDAVAASPEHWIWHLFKNKGELREHRRFSERRKTSGNLPVKRANRPGVGDPFWTAQPSSVQYNQNGRNFSPRPASRLFFGRPCEKIHKEGCRFTRQGGRNASHPRSDARRVGTGV